MIRSRAVTVLGLGNPEAGDDGAGPALVRSLAARTPTGLAAASGTGDPLSLLDAWEDATRAIVVDASSSGAPPGTVRRFDAVAAPLPASDLATSTHGLGLAAAVELGRALGRLPPELTVYAIEGADFAPGAGLSPAVALAVEGLAATLAEELASA